MDVSQYIRLKQEAANTYIARTKTVDSSFLTSQRQQKAAYAGALGRGMPSYYNGDLLLRPVLYDVGSCPAQHSFTQGYTQTNRLSQQEDHAIMAAGRVLCGSVQTASPGIQLLNPKEVSTILTQYNNLTTAPGQWPATGYGIKYFFPKKDLNSDCTQCNQNTL